MLITERISNPSPRGIHLRQSGMSFKTGWFFNIFSGWFAGGGGGGNELSGASEVPGTLTPNLLSINQIWFTSTIHAHL